MVRCTKATALRHALRQLWKLPDESSFNYIGPDWIIVLLNNVDKDTRVKLMLHFWRIWHHRNDVFGKGECPISASVIFLENYLASLNLDVVSPSTLVRGKDPCHSEPASIHLDGQSMSKKIDSWTPPPSGWIKLNVNAGSDPNTRHAGLGFVARNHPGEVIFSDWSSDRLCYSAEEAECLAGLVGICKTLLVYKGCIWLELDCLAIIQSLNDSTPNR
jgi:hypothetical protein